MSAKNEVKSIIRSVVKASNNLPTMEEEIERRIDILEKFYDTYEDLIGGFDSKARLNHSFDMFEKLYLDLDEGETLHFATSDAPEGWIDELLIGEKIMDFFNLAKRGRYEEIYANVRKFIRTYEEYLRDFKSGALV